MYALILTLGFSDSTTFALLSTLTSSSVRADEEFSTSMIYIDNLNGTCTLAATALDVFDIHSSEIKV